MCLHSPPISARPAVRRERGPPLMDVATQWDWLVGSEVLSGLSRQGMIDSSLFVEVTLQCYLYPGIVYTAG